MYNHPYNQPTYPGPGSPSPAPTPPLLPHQRLWQRFRQARRRTQWGLGCLTLLLIMSVCTCALASGGAMTTTPSSPTAANNSNTSQATATSSTTTPTKQVPPTLSAATPSPVPAQVPTPRPTATSAPVAPIPTPTRIPTQPPAPTQQPTGVNGNPWGYNFTPGTKITNPPADFCSGQYFTCVSTFWTATNGYVVECGNGVYSHSGGVRGACSRDGGVLQTLYSH